MTRRSTSLPYGEVNFPGLTAYESGRWYGLFSQDYQNGLPEWVTDSPEKLLDESRIVTSYKNHRNRLAEIIWPSKDGADKRTVVKAFGTRSWTDRVRVRTREARSIRHLKNAELLLDKGIKTPKPVFLALPKDGMGYHYLAVEPIDCYRLRDLLDRLRNGEDSVEIDSTEVSGEQLAIACGRFIREVHDQGVVHRDMSGGNILIPKSWDGRLSGLRSVFYLVDINRLRNVGAGMSIGLRIQDLEKLTFPDRYLRAYFEAYAGDSRTLLAEWPRFVRYRRAYRRMRDAKYRLWRNILMIFTYWTRSG